MFSKSAIQKELAKVKKLHEGINPRIMGDWRVGFDQGAIQALTWVLGKGEKPNKGFELRLLGKAKD